MKAPQHPDTTTTPRTPKHHPPHQDPPQNPQRSTRGWRAAAPTTGGLLLIVLLLVLAGCGGTSSKASTTASSAASQTPATTTTAPAGSSTPSTTASAPATKAPSRHVPTVEKVDISSPDIPAGGEIPNRYTCSGTNTPPPLRIKGIPAGTAELQLDLLKVAPVNNALFFAWTIAGLSPHLHTLDPGKLPPGTITGLNSSGQARYDLCPPANNNKEEYVFVLFALPHTLHPTPGYNATSQRLQAVHSAKYEGFLVFETKPR